MIKTKIREFLENNIFSLFYLYRYYQFNKAKIKIDSLVKRHKLKYFDELDLNKYKTSNTLYILGSGSSINELGKDEWDKIRDADSIGLNFWFIHDFIPTFYMFESIRDKERANKFHEILNYKQEDYKDVPFIIKDLEVRDFNYKKVPENIEIYAPYRFCIPGSNKRSLKKSINKIKKSSVIKNKNLHLFKRASLSQAIYFGYISGYKNIVLCGIDLNNSAYFYEDEYYQNKEYNIPKTGQSKAIHKTIDTSHGKTTIDLVIKVLNEYLLQPKDIKLFIGSKKSALFPYLQYFFVKD